MLHPAISVEAYRCGAKKGRPKAEAGQRVLNLAGPSRGPRAGDSVGHQQPASGFLDGAIAVKARGIGAAGCLDDLEIVVGDSDRRPARARSW